MPLTANSPPDPQLAAIAALQRRARAADQRALVVAAGSPDWGRRLAEAQWALTPTVDRLWLGESVARPGQRRLREAGQLLGQERQLVIFDAHDGFSADALGAISGTLCGGGLLLMLVPALDDWPTQPGANPFAASPSRFIRQLAACLAQDPAPLLLEEPDRWRASRHVYPPHAARHQGTPPCRSADQQRAVEALIELGAAADPRPLVITSDRGRGKSSALGIAAARLLQRHPGWQIGVCAPRPAACAALFERAAALLPQARAGRNRLDYAGGGLRFVAADALLDNPPALDLLLIDEAAAFPVPILEKLLQLCPRVVFASTVHGYEGTGRGFALRFTRRLEHQAPGWQALQLAQPIRWQAGDPLEQFVFRALLLDAEPAPVDEPVSAADCRFIELDRDRLVHSPAYLRQLFGLLVLAHYRTRPEDLYRLLDAPDLRLFVLEHHAQPLAVAVLGIEGGFDAPTAQAIYLGRRRPQGHLLAQSLAFHAGVPDAARYRYGRIMRLGVHPQRQRQGLGSALLEQLIHTLKTEGRLDALGASFSADPDLLPFWRRAGLEPVRIGLTREHTSGQHALLVLKPLGAAGQGVFDRARQRLQQHWPTLRAGPLRELEPALAAQLQPAATIPIEQTLGAADIEDINSFVHGLRGYEVCAWPIEKLLRQLLADPAHADQLTAQDRQLLIRRVIDKQGWPAICAGFKLDGQKAARRRVRDAVGRAWQLWENS